MNSIDSIMGMVATEAYESRPLESAPTPRTNEKQNALIELFDAGLMSHEHGVLEMILLARTLERELAERTADVERIQALHNGLMADAEKRYDEMCAKLIAMGQEVERLIGEVRFRDKAVREHDATIARLREDAERFQVQCDLMCRGLLHLDRSDSTAVEHLKETLDHARRETSTAAPKKK